MSDALKRSAWLFVCALAVLLPAIAFAQTPVPRTGRVLITVVDPSGAIVADATVNVVGLDTAAGATQIKPMKTSDKGTVLVEGMVPGRYSFQAQFPGFEFGLLRDVRVQAGDSKHVIVLPLKRVEDTVTVGADRQAAAADRGRMTFGQSLTLAEIQALSEDPNELRRQLEELAGPDAIFRVDSFEGAQMPLKSQIKSIHITRDQFAAETATPGSTFVEIITQAGLGTFRGQLNYSFRDNAWAAKGPFTPTKPDGRNSNFGGSISGPIAKEKADFTFSLNTSRSYNMAELNAMLPNGQRAEVLPVKQEFRDVFYTGTVNWAPTRNQTVRVGYGGSFYRSDNDGVGGYDLPERASSSEESNFNFRIGEAGPIGRRTFLNTRLTVNANSYTQRSAIEAPTVVVQDAFTRGGAQLTGKTTSRDFIFASDLDYVKGIHSWRTGIQARGAWFSTSANENYLGTFTFASLDDYNAGRPILFERAVGNPNLSYFNANTGVYFQDDIRVRRGFTMSPGVRYSVQTGISDYSAIEPRFGITWAPAKSGRTTLRASMGIFHNWIGTEVIEQTLRVDGTRQLELSIADPPYPDPGTVGVIPPGNKYLLGDVRLQKGLRYSGGVDHTFSPKFRVNVLYNYFHQMRQTRGRNLNPLVNGVRPDSTFANVIESVTDAENRRHDVFINYALNPTAGAAGGAATQAHWFNWRRFTINGTFSSIRVRRNADGPFYVPPSGTLDTEWGTGPADAPWQTNTTITSTQIRNLTINMNIVARIGTTYHQRTGFDDNGDGLLNDRPVGVGLWSLRGSDQLNTTLRLNYAITAGSRPVPATTPNAAAQPRYRMNVFVNIGNWINRVNYQGFSGVMTSPFYLEPTRANPMRNVNVGMNILF